MYATRHAAASTPSKVLYFLLECFLLAYLVLPLLSHCFPTPPYLLLLASLTAYLYLVLCASTPFEVNWSDEGDRFAASLNE